MCRMHKEQMPREYEAKKEEVATMIHRIDADGVVRARPSQMSDVLSGHARASGDT